MKASFFDHLEKLKKFDLFGQPVSILIDRQKLHQTYFGSLLSLIVLGIVIYTFSVGIEEALSGSSPKVTSQKTLLEPLEYTFEKNQLFLLGQVLTPNGQIITNQQNKTYYTISFGACVGIGTDVKCTIIPSIICGDSISEYAKSIGADNTKATTAYCMPPEYRENSTFTLEGQILTTKFQYLYISVQKCFNSTKFNYTCASSQEIEVALYNSYLVYTYSKMELDPNKNGNPYKLLGQYSLVRLQPGQKKTTYIYYAKSISKTNLNFWLVSNQQQTYEALEYSGETMEVQNIEAYDPVLAISFFSLSNNKITYSRTYGNIFDILGKVGGLLSLLTSILKFTVQLYQWFDLKMSILKLLNIRENNGDSQVNQKSLSKGLTMSVMNYLTNRSERAKLKWHIEDIERQIDIVEILTKMRGIDFMKKQIDELFLRNPGGGGMILDRSQVPLDKSDVILEKGKLDKEESYHLNQEGQASQIHMFSPNYSSAHQIHARHSS